MSNENMSPNEPPSCETASGFVTSPPLPFSTSPPLSRCAPSPPVPLAVLHLINGEHYAGAERVQDLLAQRLPEFGFHAGFACVKLDVFDAMRASRAAPLYNVPMRTKFDLRAVRRVVKIIRQGDYRLVHAHTVRTLLVGGLAAAIAGVPLVYHVHSPTTHDTTHRWRNRLNGLIERLCLRRVSRAISVSQAMADHIAGEGFDPARITVVPNGTPSPSALPPRRPSRECWTLGMVALFRPRKGIEVLLEAMALLRRRGIRVNLRAVGAFESSKYESEIAAHVHRLELNEQVVWTGFSRCVAAELQKIDLLTLPSLFGEGLPMVVLEAMAAGVPIVASRVPGVWEAIRHGIDGVLTDPADAESLAAAIADVMAGRYDWSALRTNAFARHAERFSDRAMAGGVAAVYRELLEHSGTIAH
jgi:glycosyltransferase involved in cell wall biosynthesis